MSPSSATKKYTAWLDQMDGSLWQQLISKTLSMLKTTPPVEFEKDFVLVSLE